MREILPSLEEATQETLDAMDDRIVQMNAVLRGDGAGADPVTALRQLSHSVKGLAAAVGVDVIKVLAHRLEDYLAASDTLGPQARADAQVFVDRMAEAMDGELHVGSDEIAAFCRRLPVKRSFEPADVEVRDVEVMLVMAPGAAANFVTRELAECGYRMVNVWSTLDALALAGSMRPDLVVVSNVMPELTGVDFACALTAMPSTKGIPVALLTSETREHPSLKDLPPEVPLLSKSARFADDVTEVFSTLGLL